MEATANVIKYIFIKNNIHTFSSQGHLHRMNLLLLFFVVGDTGCVLRDFIGRLDVQSKPGGKIKPLVNFKFTIILCRNKNNIFPPLYSGGITRWCNILEILICICPFFSEPYQIMFCIKLKYVTLLNSKHH